ncbi:MAG: lipoyl(octanoyl) transferase LipB [Burkholderiaceae bacterium]
MKTAQAPGGADGEHEPPPVVIRPLSRRDYESCRQAMQAFTRERDQHTTDEIWLTEHPPVYTLGLAGKPEHLLDTSGIDVVRTERGGQVTYHGPGQVIAYTLIDLARRRMTIRGFVCLLEQAVIDTLAARGLHAVRRPGAPGVYLAGDHELAGAKIASLGLKVSRGRVFHGVALNVAMDLTPFAGINPCGMAGLPVTDLAHCDILADTAQIGEELARAIVAGLDGQAQASS